MLTVLKIIVQHTFLKIKNCGEFNQNAIIARSPKYIIGNIDIENLTLHITGKMIDDIFETGTCELDNNKTDELKEKLLLFGKSKNYLKFKTLDVFKMVLMKKEP